MTIQEIKEEVKYQIRAFRKKESDYCRGYCRAMINALSLLNDLNMETLPDDDEDEEE